MGDLQLWPQQLDGVSAAEDDHNRPSPLSPSASSSTSRPPNPHHSAIGADAWMQAEQATQEVIHHILPTVVSEQRRKAVVDYVQKLIRGFLNSEISAIFLLKTAVFLLLPSSGSIGILECKYFLSNWYQSIVVGPLATENLKFQRALGAFEGSLLVVFPFGSVPLKTYLPDGDIDLTTVGFPNIEDALAANVRSVLEVQAHNKDAEFEVKDVQLIHAEVKLVKCLVQNIVVDISFNQIGGLCTLCFLEQVDRLIGKDHLFKRSIILIKAWCYYESRILGAQHGLISTYALETLILYIFHLFHSSLHAPLAVSSPNDTGNVLYKFLDYYSKFDWDNFCVSLNGPVSVSSLLELPAETAETDGGNLLLTKEFFRSCVDNFSVAPKGSDSRNFIKKHLNIVDPLRESNNLGRSVSKGNFYRIRSAFTYGAWKLGRLLLLPGKSIANEVNMFFLNTIDRHGSGERPDVQDLIPRCLDGASDLVNGVFVPSAENIEKEHADKQSSESPTTDACIDSGEGNKNIRISSLDGYDDRVPLQRQSSYKQKNVTTLESGGVEVDGVSCVRLIDDAKDLASVSASVSSEISENYSTSVSTSEAGISSFGKDYHVPHSFYVPENENGKDLTSDTINSDNLGSSHTVSFNRASGSPEEMSNSVQLDSCETDSSSSCTSSTSNHGSAFPSESLHFANQAPSVNEWNDTNGSYNVPNKFSDLTGDYEMHFRSLSYARWCQEQITMTYFLPIHQSPTYAYHQSRDAWSRGSMYTPMNANGVTPRPPFSPGYYPINVPFLPNTYGTEPKPRGTGTYFPNTNHRVYKERQYPGRGKNPMTANQFPRPRINGRSDISHDKNLEKGPHEPATQTIPMFGGSGRGRPPVLDIPHSSFRPALKGSPHANGINLPTDYGRLEFGSLGHVSFGTLSLENGNSHSQDSGFSNPALIEQRPAIHSNRERRISSISLQKISTNLSMTAELRSSASQMTSET
ncbi:hypothetical protein IEQ34_012032 [Dendrobium chrysotoxum]|uniref:PAP/OAS1 substrate-binding-related domain-containing protein n=1 Tax=Dendrobium chrysotoxum TaxID=161865 RepID=A0AAV7GU08_DENCH|nr:hypothetical protein IEQ34_012032 [Dendrobium chrysotoxum]